jgi:predicted nucleotidyltransferase
MSGRENEIIEGVEKSLQKHLNPEVIYLFGSRAKKTNDARADFDFAVSGKKPDLKTLRKIETEIDELRGLYKVDLIFLDAVDEAFREIVVKSGVKLYARNRLRD